MSTQPVKSDSKMLYLQARHQFEKAQAAFESGQIKTETQLIQDVFRSFEEFFTSAGKPNMMPRYAPEGGPPWSDDYNDMMDEIKQDLEILFAEIDSLGRALYTDFNHNMVQQEILSKKFEDVLDNMKDLELYSGVVSGKVQFARDNFLNRDKIDYDRISGKPLEVTNGSVSLPMSIRDNVSTDAKVTIITGNSEKGNYILGAESNGFPGNNTEIHTTTDGVLTSQNYTPTFIGEQSNHGNYADVLDGSPNTWFEYEKVNIREHDRVRVAKNIGWDYRVYENTTIQWAADPSNGVLKLHMQVFLPEEKVINQINVNMYTPPNYGAKTAIVRDILVTDGKTPPQSVLPVSKQDTDYNFNFEPRNAKVISILFEQPDKYMTDIGHVYYDKKSETQATDQYAMDAVSQQHRHSVRVEGPIISLQDLGISVNVSDSRVDAKYPLLDSSYTEEISMNAILGELTRNVTDEHVDIGVEKFEGWRWAIGIRDIEIYSCEYEEEGELVSKPFFFDKPIDKISLDVDELLPEPLLANALTKYDYLQYFISIDDGGRWHPITPMNHQIVLDEQPPKIYTVRTIQSRDQQLEGKSGYIESEHPVYSIRLKVVGTRPDVGDMHIMSTGDASQMGTQLSPILNSYNMQIMTEHDPSDSSESYRMIAGGDAGMSPYDPPVEEPDYGEDEEGNQKPDGGCDPTNPWHASDPNSPCYQPDCDPTDPNSWCYCDPNNPIAWCHQPKPEEPKPPTEPECNPKDPFSECYEPPTGEENPDEEKPYDGELTLWIDNKPAKDMERRICIDHDVVLTGRAKGPKVLKRISVYFNGEEVYFTDVQLEHGNLYEVDYNIVIRDFIVNTYFHIGDRFGVKVVVEDIEGNKDEDNFMVAIVDCPLEESGDFPEHPEDPEDPNNGDPNVIKVVLDDKPISRRNICVDHDIVVTGNVKSPYNIRKIIFYLDETVIAEREIEGDQKDVDFDFLVRDFLVNGYYGIGDEFLVKVRAEDEQGFHDVEAFEARIVNCPNEAPGDYDEERGEIRVTYDKVGHIHECIEDVADMTEYPVRGHVDSDRPVHTLRYYLGTTLLREVNLSPSEQGTHVEFDFTFDLSSLAHLGPSIAITSIKVEGVDETGVKGMKTLRICLIRCQKVLKLTAHKKRNLCFNKDTVITGRAWGPKVLDKIELFMTIGGVLEKIQWKTVYTNDEQYEFLITKEYLASKGFTEDNLPSSGSFPISFEVRAFDTVGKEIRKQVNGSLIDCTDIPDDSDAEELTITIDHLNKELCNCEDLVISGSVEGPLPISSVVLKINGVELNPYDLGTPPANDPCADPLNIQINVDNKAQKYCFDSDGIAVTGKVGSNYPMKSVILRANGEVIEEVSFTSPTTQYNFDWKVDAAIDETVFFEVEVLSENGNQKKVTGWTSVIEDCSTTPLIPLEPPLKPELPPSTNGNIVFTSTIAEVCDNKNDWKTDIVIQSDKPLSEMKIQWYDNDRPVYTDANGQDEPQVIGGVSGITGGSLADIGFPGYIYNPGTSQEIVIPMYFDADHIARLSVFIKYEDGTSDRFDYPITIMSCTPGVVKPNFNNGLTQPSNSINYFCGTTAYDTSYWNGAHGPIQGIRNNFWEGRNDWITIFEGWFSSDPDMKNAGKSKLNESDIFWTHLYRFYEEDVLTNRVTLPEPFSKFEAWAKSNLTCFGSDSLMDRSKRGTIYATYKLKKMTIVHDDTAENFRFLEDDVLDMLAPYIKMTPSFTYHWIDINDIKSDMRTLAWVYGANEQFLSYANFEETTLTSGITSANAHRPTDYTCVKGNDFGDAVRYENMASYYIPMPAVGDATYDQLRTGFSKYVGIYSAGETIVHEIGHAVAFYAPDAYPNQYPNEGRAFHDWDEWREISGWIPYGPDDDVNIPYTVGGKAISNLTKSATGNMLSNGKEAPVTPYGTRHPSEDFADAYAMYRINPNALKDRWPLKWAFMEQWIKNLPRNAGRPTVMSLSEHDEMFAYADYELECSCSHREHKPVLASMNHVIHEAQMMTAASTSYEIDWIIPYWKLIQMGLEKNKKYVIDIRAYDSENSDNYDDTISLLDCTNPEDDKPACLKTESVIVRYYNPVARAIKEEIIPISNLPYHLDNGNGVVANICLSSSGNSGPSIQIIGGNDHSGYAFQVWAMGVNYYEDKEKTNLVTEWASSIYKRSDNVLNPDLMIGDPATKDPDSWLQDVTNGDYSSAPSLSGMHDYVQFYISSTYSSKQCWEPGVCNPLAPPSPPPLPENPIEDCLEVTDILIEYYDTYSKGLRITRIPINQNVSATYLVSSGLEIKVAWSKLLQGIAIEIIEGEGIENLLLTAVGMMYKDENLISQTTWAANVRWQSQGVQNPAFAIGGKKTMDQVTWVQNGIVNYTYATYVGSKGDIVAYQVEPEIGDRICGDKIPDQPDIPIEENQAKPSVVFDIDRLCILEELKLLPITLKDSMMLKEYEYEILVNDAVYMEPAREGIPYGLQEFNIYPMIDQNSLLVGDKVTVIIRVWNQYGVMTESVWEGIVSNCDNEDPVVTFDPVPEQICLTDIHDDGAYCVSFEVTDNMDVERWRAYVKDENGDIAWEDELSYPDVETETGKVYICPPVIMPEQKDIVTMLPQRADIVFLFDSSGSMNNQSDTGIIGNVRKNMEKFLNYLRDNGFDAWVGYTDSNFADEHYQRLPLSPPQEVVKHFTIDLKPLPIQMDPDGTPGQGWEGMRWRQIHDPDKGGYSFFGDGPGKFRSSTKKHFVLVTDTCMGSSEVNSPIGPPEIQEWLLQDLIERNITVNAIRLAGEDADPMYDPSVEDDEIYTYSLDDVNTLDMRGDYSEVVYRTGGALLDVTAPDLWEELKKLAHKILDTQTYYPDFTQTICVEAWDNAGNQTEKCLPLHFHDCEYTPPPELVSVRINEPGEQLCWNHPTDPNDVRSLTASAIYRNHDGTTFVEDVTFVGSWSNNNPSRVTILDSDGRTFEGNSLGDVTFTFNFGGKQDSVTFTINECVPELPPIPCGQTATAGGSGITVNMHPLGSTGGLVTVDYDMYSAPDSLDIYYRDVLVASTNGFVSGSGTLSFLYTPVANVHEIKVVAEGASSGTAWNYTVNCPVPPDEEIEHGYDMKVRLSWGSRDGGCDLDFYGSVDQSDNGVGHGRNTKLLYTSAAGKLYLDVDSTGHTSPTNSGPEIITYEGMQGHTISIGIRDYTSQGLAGLSAMPKVEVINASNDVVLKTFNIPSNAFPGGGVKGDFHVCDINVKAPGMTTANDIVSKMIQGRLY